MNHKDTQELRFFLKKKKKNIEPGHPLGERERERDTGEGQGEGEGESSVKSMYQACAGCDAGNVFGPPAACDTVVHISIFGAL